MLGVAGEQGKTTGGDGDSRVEQGVESRGEQRRGGRGRGRWALVRGEEAAGAAAGRKGEEQGEVPAAGNREGGGDRSGGVGGGDHGERSTGGEERGAGRRRSRPGMKEHA